jgi:predicted alpha/beta superfamily hydrolase
MTARTGLSWLLSLAFAVAVTWLAASYWFGRELPDPSVLQRSLRSGLLGETRAYLVHLPEGYAREPARRYPVIYVLDGSSQDVHTAASAELMARIGASPETIVVGIPNVDGKGRQRDYTPPGMRQDIDDADGPQGRADRFLAFLRSELIPHVEREFRANGERTLAGNSRGGLFAVYALTASDGLFEHYIANSPALWRDDGEMVKRLDRYLRDHRGPRGDLFLSLGGAENAKMKRAFGRAVATLQRDAGAGLRWKAYTTPAATHADNAVKATPVALRWIADDDARNPRPLPSGA